MDQHCLRLYVREGLRHQGQRIHDWVFDRAREAGFTGGTVFRASADFGSHGRDEDGFFELAGQLTEALEFIGSPDQVEALLAVIGASGLRLAYSVHPVRFGVTSGP